MPVSRRVYIDVARASLGQRDSIEVSRDPALVRIVAGQDGRERVYLGEHERELSFDLRDLQEAIASMAVEVVEGPPGRPT